MHRRWRVAVLVLIAAGAAGCSSGGTQGGATTGAHPSGTPATPVSTSASAAAGLPRDCDQIAVASDVDKLAGHQLAGAMSGVVGIPEPSIGRTGRLDCYYGVPPGQPVTAALVSVSLTGYRDQQTAQKRAALTVTDARNAGATTSQVLVGQDKAVLIAGAQGQELVLAKGNLTVLVSANPGTLPPGNGGAALISLAQRALSATPH